MEHALLFLALVLFFVVIFTIFNEKVIKIPDEIALLLFSVVIGIIISLLIGRGIITVSESALNAVKGFRLDKILLDILLCFMLFTGASELKLPSLVHNFKPICFLALLTTLLTSAIYGLLFFGVLKLIGMDISFVLCFLLGSIVSPTDPIAATAILNKAGLTKNVTTVMEGESLFNDGTGVALYIFIKDLYMDTKGSNFFVVMSKELFGALFVGLLLSFFFSLFLKVTRDPIKHIMISMLTVSLCYTICEFFGFSGVIASVVCGIYFSTFMEKYKNEDKELDPNDYYKDFWAIIDKILNYALYVLIGMSFVYLKKLDMFVIIGVAAIVINLVARYLGVLTSVAILRQCPDQYKIQPFTVLMTWSGLKGGLCLALAMSASNYLPTDVYQFILYVTYITIMFTTGVQGLTVGKLFEYIKKKWNMNSDSFDCTKCQGEDAK